MRNGRRYWTSWTTSSRWPPPPGPRSEVEGRVSRTRDLAAEGSNVEVFLTSFTEPGRASTNLTAAISALERARRRTRRQIVIMGRAEGLSLGQLAAFWGVSRQLISRLTREPPDEDGPRPER